MRYKGTLAVTAALLLAACGASPTADTGSGTAGGNDAAGTAAAAAKEVYDQINGLTGDQRRQKLVELAEKEGNLSIYTSNTDMDKLVAGFEKAYKIKVSTYRGNSESVLQRILQEQKAKYLGNDVVDSNAGELNVLNAQHILYPYLGALRDSVRKEGQKDGWTASRMNVFVVGWNTNLVKPGQQPKSIEELADPRWKGKISMEASDVDWFAGLYQHYTGQGKSDAEVRDLFTRIAANAKIVKGHTTQGELLSAGQFAVAVSAYSHTIDKAAADGAPVTWHPTSSPVQPIVIRPNGVALMATATHPAAAMLFVDWELTEGQKILAGAKRIGSIPTAKDPLAGLNLIPVPEQELLNDPKKWDGMYDQMIRAGQEVK